MYFSSVGYELINLLKYYFYLFIEMLIYYEEEEVNVYQ